MDKTKILKLFPHCIPYVKELRSLTGSINSAILMQQFDYYFMCRPKGFYKFSQPSGHPEYREGDSWIETLNFSFKEFKNAWKRIGITYASKTAYNQAKGDKFQGKFYCAYIDRKQNNKTYYFRNHALLNECLEALPQSKELTAFRTMNSDQTVVHRKQTNLEDENSTCSMQTTIEGELACPQDSTCLLTDLALDATESASSSTNPNSDLPMDQRVLQELPKESFPLDKTKNTQENTTKERKEKAQKEKEQPNHFFSFSSSDKYVKQVNAQTLNEPSENVKSGLEPYSTPPSKTSLSRLEIRTQFGQLVQPLIEQLMQEFDHLDLREERERLHKKLFEKYEQYGYSVDFVAKQLQDYLKYHAASPFPMPKFQTADAFLDQGLSRDYATKLKKMVVKASSTETVEPASSSFKPLLPEQKAKLQERMKNYEANKQNKISNGPK